MAMELAVQVDELERNRDLIRKTIAPSVQADEFELFMAVCKEVRLNPMTRQIYALSTYDTQLRANKMSIQTSIDGLRLLAERSGQYAGQIGPEWCGTDGKWVDVWVSDEMPVAARVGVLRKDFQAPLFSVAKFKTYAKRKRDGSLMYMWESMPDHMLAKCAESLALRRAFPHETHGLYTREEMGQAMVEDAIEGEVLSSETTTASTAKTTESAAPKVEVNPSMTSDARPPRPAKPVPTAAPANTTENKPAEQSALKIHALGRVAKRCDEMFGREKGAIVYRNIRAHVVKTLNLGDVPDELMPDNALGEMWSEFKKAERKQQQTAKAS